MSPDSSLIETGVDKLVKFVNNKGKASTSEAAKELGVSTTVIMEWAEFLEEEGILNIEYKLTKTYLVARKLAKKDVTKKAKEYTGKKDIFVRKAEVSLGFLEKEADKLAGIKKEFDKIKEELGIDIGSIKNELEELEKYEKLKIDLDKQLENQKSLSMDKIHNMSSQISRERKKYTDILASIKKEEDALSKEQKTIKSMKDSETLIQTKLKILRKTIDDIESKILTEEENVNIHEKNIDRLSKLAETVKSNVENEMKVIDPLVQQSQDQEKKIKDLQARVISQLEAKEKKMKGAQKASKKIKSLFDQKNSVIAFIEQINKDRNDLKNELTLLIKKAKSFQVSAKSANVADEIVKLQERFDRVDEKKKNFEKELKKLSSLFSS